MRIYVVKTNGEPVRYVRASSQSAAVRAVVNERFTATVATADDIYRASKTGQIDVLDTEPLPDIEDESPTVDTVRHNSRMPVDA